MADTPKTVWVIGADYGLEGKGEPEMVFLDKGNAEQALSLINKSGSKPRYLCATPVWQYGPEENGERK